MNVIKTYFKLGIIQFNVPGKKKKKSKVFYFSNNNFYNNNDNYITLSYTVEFEPNLNFFDATASVFIDRSINLKWIEDIGAAGLPGLTRLDIQFTVYTIKP